MKEIRGGGGWRIEHMYTSENVYVDPNEEI